ncbi:hypothetical protein WJX81_000350 [Elliptochloris bilobata]|uniref:BFN domain-containing protein n=1 Tax=Elliptochloris bilobata TaxID=381761 RepID=A0AAW1SI71_9CHLO
MSYVQGAAQDGRSCEQNFHRQFSFNERDYHRVSLQAIHQQAHTVGTLIMSRDDQRGAPGADALCITVSGDTFQGIMMMMSRQPVHRPLSLDLLWQILERGHDISKRDWRLMRVAIVGMQNTTFIGRLFFGDSDSGSTVWDCDCRPSDGLWLALKCKCPVFVNKVVWAKSATSIARLLSGSTEPLDDEELSTTAALTTIRGDEPEPIKRLKREMAVALQEEDYVTAARLRDHPFLQTHMRILQLLREGRGEAASAMELELTRLIDAQQTSDRAE